MPSPGPALKPLLLALLVFAALAAPTTASAQQPCWKELVNDYWADNRVDKIYPVSCYREAMEKLPRDVQEYSDAQDDLRRALLAAIRDERTRRGFDGVAGEDEGGEAAPAITGDDDDASPGFITEVLRKLGPKNADEIPVPLLILGGLALVLVGAAGASYAARWFQARRLDVAPTERP